MKLPKAGQLSRREFTCAAAAGILLPQLSWSAEENKSLGALAQEKGILFGTAVAAQYVAMADGKYKEPQYAELIARECAVLVPENELKGYVIAAQQGVQNFKPADDIAKFARAHQMKLRGHTLLWNRDKYTPKWQIDWLATQSRSSAERYLRDYIRDVCSRYREQIRSWDVVNETIDPDTGEMRSTAFTRVLGSDAVRIAFEAAREHAPNTQLVYNDYMSWEEGNEKHRAGVLKLLEQFKRDGVPVDALGVQSHLGNDGHINKPQQAEWKKFIDEVVGMGYRLLITEFDVNDKDLPTDASARDAQVAAAASRYLDVMLAYKELDQVLCWGLADHLSWLQGFSPRTDRQPQRPTPYDAAFQPKPLRAALAAAFKAAPKR
jgi:endo-1,4-beta-xylanase